MSVRAILVLPLLAAACAPSAADRFVVQHVDTQLRLTPDGALHVHETWNVRFDAPGARTFRHQLAANRHDEIVEIEASLDGAPVPETGGPRRVRIRRGAVPSIQWTFEPLPSASQVFELRYHVTGVVALDGMRARLDWSALPAPRSFDVEAASISLAAPPSAVRLSEPRIDSPGWKTMPFVEGMLFEKSGIGREEQATVTAEFLTDSMTLLEPEWQANDARRRYLIPASISAGLFILVIGAGILLMLHVQYPQRTDAAHPELARGLLASGIVSIVFGLICGAVVYWTLRQLGPWPMAIPASIVIVGMMLVGAGIRRRTSRPA